MKKKKKTLEINRFKLEAKGRKQPLEATLFAREILAAAASCGGRGILTELRQQGQRKTNPHHRKAGKRPEGMSNC